jgi:hypothetical protein
VGFGNRVALRRFVPLLAIAIVVAATTVAVLLMRRATLERRLATQADVDRLHSAAETGRSAMLAEIARIRETLRDVVDAPSRVRVAMMAELAGNDPERSAILLENQRVTMIPARVLRYVPDAPSREPEALIARSARLLSLPRASRQAEAAAIVRDLESGTWTLSRDTYESYRDELEDFVSADRGLPLWEEAVHALSAASRATADRGGEMVIWIDASHPVLLIWRTGPAAAIALAVTGRHVADRWLRAERDVVYGIETADRQVFLPHPPGDPRAERLLSFAGHEWRMVAAAWPPLRAR